MAQEECDLLLGEAEDLSRHELLVAALAEEAQVVEPRVDRIAHAVRHRAIRGKAQREAAKQAANDERVRAVINGAGSPIQYMDAPEFKVYWDKESAQMGEVVRKIGKVE